MDLKEKEEQLKSRIFNIFLEFKGDAVPDRQKCFAQLCDQIFKWCKDYLYRDAGSMAMEIFDIIKRIAGKEKSQFKNKEDFFKYLSTSLKKGKIEYLRTFKSDIIHIPKDKMAKFKKAINVIRMKESILYRELNEDERVQCVSEWLSPDEYTDILYAIRTSDIWLIGDKSNNNMENNPPDNYISHLDRENVLEAVKIILDKKQERSRACYRALFTLYCIENFRDFSKLYSALDRQILEIWLKSGKKPKQYEIYQKYHPNAQKSSAEAMASKNLGDLLSEIESCLKINNP